MNCGSFINSGWQRSGRRTFQILIFGFIVALFPSSFALAHATSDTRIDVKTENDALVITLALNQSDMLEHVLHASHSSGHFADRTELEDASPTILRYVRDGLLVTADGKPLPRPAAVNWPPQHVELTHIDAGGLEVPSTIPMTLRYVLPSGAKHIELTPRLFAAPNFAAIFTVNIFRGGASRPITSVSDNHQTVAFDLTIAPSGSGAEPISSESEPTFAQTIVQFLGMGFRHIIPDGLDHILFVLGLYFLSPKIRDLLWQVTAFTIAHSITLALAAFHIFSLPGRIVEPLIALSITTVGVENLFSRKVHPWRWVVVFCFGLIHGMGFADILRETRLPTGEALTALLGFNVGVEIAQLAILLTAMLLTGWWQKRTWYFGYVAAPASIVIACIGAFWAVQRIFC